MEKTKTKATILTDGVEKRVTSYSYLKAKRQSENAIQGPGPQSAPVHGSLSRTTYRIPTVIMTARLMATNYCGELPPDEYTLPTTTASCPRRQNPDCAGCDHYKGGNSSGY